MKSVIKIVFAAAALMLALAPSAALAQIRFDISKAPTAAPIAVSALKNLAGDDDHSVSAEFDRVLMRDLKLSSYFRIISPKFYIEDAQNSGYDIGQFNFSDWSSLGADFLVKGAVKASGDSIMVEALLFDVPQQRRIMGKRFTGGLGDVGEMARRFADAVLQAATGVRGPFDSKLAFVSTRGGRFKEVYTAWLDGGDLFRVTDNPTINLFPSFDSGARHLLYLSYKTYTPVLYLVDLSRKVETPIAPGLGQAVGGALTPDGRIVAAYSRGGHTNLYLLDSSGGEIRALTQNRAINVSPSVCADGSQIAFTSDRSGTPQIYVESLDGGDARRVTYQGSYNTAPAFSPDCKKIAYESREGGAFQIFTIDAGGGNARQLTVSGSNESPTWSPDGRYIAFGSTRGGRSRIYLMRALDGYVIAPLTEGEGNDSNPSWSGWLGD
ncbi:PD40 domain-containing protein [bacterium]|nr:PD40 domain-containing protein [bacterium]